MKKVFITGITGFAGSFLAEHIASQKDYEIFGSFLSDTNLENTASVKEKVSLRQIDLRDSQKLQDLIKEIRPDFVYHLAALTSPADSFKNPAGFINNNTEAEVNLLEAIRVAGIFPKVLIASSAEVYGEVAAGNLPIDEDTPLRPATPYAVSKIAQDFLGLQYFISYKIPVIRVRPFNHIGPRQAPNFVVSSFSKRIVDIERGKESVMRVGNLMAKRDFTDVRDIVRGYLLLLEMGDPGDVYNIGSGKSYKISEILDKLLSMSNKDIKIEIDKQLLRPIDVPELVCDNKKIFQKTGWKPEIPIEKTLADTLDYWRSMV
ncbi:MAG: hypothetical protein A3C27_02035 [Candidatus Levybacteria bacterium RIFCSPHIGHO2_02_FULL_39_36]|nr:MAG: hypothetical protein A3C27_02035 [Candidatus Levybacteria bacterium RIFCSPHIGHO2_02_FULL_39_36]OGH45713.1 MAG: hypothetical protein A3H82_03515 [Candidatus Levybacteria bacterium RIFCSPLOWO2_02_FULL_39_26]OGH48483.1 MAG: hypothetical protein A3G66_00675 [Candidatus Levybacteria bacterium RIFCSPLOWO2_12_FULL_39_17]